MAITNTAANSAVRPPRTRPRTYDGHAVHNLARRCSFEQVAYLIWQGEMPSREQLTAFRRAERAQRSLPPEIVTAIAAQPAHRDPADVLRMAVTMLGKAAPAEDHSPATVCAAGLRLLAAMPSMIAFGHRHRHGLPFILPRDDLGYAENFLNMVLGKVPEPQIGAAFESSLILYAGNDPADPAVTAAISAARSPSTYSAVAAALSALCENPPRRSAGEAVIPMLREIGGPRNAGPWLRQALSAGRQIPGFAPATGYRDPAPRIMRRALGMIAGLRRGQSSLLVGDALAAVAHETTNLRPTLDFPASLAYRLIGFDAQELALVAAAAAIPAWTWSIADGEQF